MPSITSVDRTGNQDIDGLLSGVAWRSGALTYSFPKSGSYYGTGYANGEPRNTFSPLDSVQMAAVRAALAQFSAVANVTFSEMTETATRHADIRLANTGVGNFSTAWSYGVNTSAAGGDVWFSNGQDYRTPTLGTYAFKTVLHELGHSLGLKHGHETGGYGAITAAHDAMEYSIMTYRSYAGQTLGGGYTNGYGSYAQTLMMFDIAALQKMYGANYTTNAGNSVYTWDAATGEMRINGVGQGAPAANKVFQTVWDGGGVDTYDLSNYSGNTRIDLRPGEWSITAPEQLADLGNGHTAVGNVANALQFNADPRSLIENAIGGAGDNAIYGNAAANLLRGGAGNDVMNGFEGADTLAGEDGNDTLFAGSGNDVLDGGAGIDGVSYYYAAAPVVLNLATGLAADGLAGTDTLVSIEIVYGSANNDTLTGGVGNDDFRGNDGDDSLSGGDGNDFLIGGAGKDTLAGGAGFDSASYYYSTGPVVANLSTGSASDGMGSTDALSGIERLYGSAYGDSFTGGSAAEEFWGNDGDDSLYGGSGNDFLVGGAGKDTLAGGTGFDSASYYYSTGPVVANLSTGSASDGLGSTDVLSGIERLYGSAYGDSFTGGSAAEEFWGNDGDDSLYGGSGNDFLVGGAGKDTLVGGSGTDTVSYAGSWAVMVNLATGIAQDGLGSTDRLSQIETILGSAYADTLSAGSTAASLFGNDGNDSLTGGAGADTLQGGIGDDVLAGGLGANSLVGGAGHDIYVVSSAEDRVVEEVDGGIDEVQSLVTFVLGANVENLVLMGTAAISGTGNELDNVVLGSSGANLLSGLGGDDMLDGGAGNDTLAGGAGSDLYVVDSTLDVVTEAANAGNDTVQASVSLTLSANVEALVLTGSVDLSGTGNALANLLVGNAGNNFLSGEAGGDTLSGDDGNDTLVGGAGSDFLDGGAGTDAISYYYSTAAVSVNLSTGRASDGLGGTDTLASVEVVYGSASGDTIVGTAGSDEVWGNDGNDSLSGGNGDDFLAGAAGSDTLVGGSGFDSANYYYSGGAISANLSTGIISDGMGATDRVSGIERLYGSAYGDSVTGGSAAEEFWGNDGSDSLAGAAGVDTLQGGGGDDTLDGGSGADALYGWYGNDTYVVDTSADQVIELAAAGTDTVLSAVSWTLGDNLEALVLSGSAAINGTGNALANLLTGNSGKNILTGGLGRDSLTGGGSADQFVWASVAESSNSAAQADSILDFSGSGGDRINLAAIDANIATSADDAFSFIGTAAFTSAGQVRSFASGADLYLGLNVDSNLTTTDMLLKIANLASFNAAWMIA